MGEFDQPALLLGENVCSSMLLPFTYQKYLVFPAHLNTDKRIAVVQWDCAPRAHPACIFFSTLPACPLTHPTTLSPPNSYLSFHNPLAVLCWHRTGEDFLDFIWQLLILLVVLTWDQEYTPQSIWELMGKSGTMHIRDATVYLFAPEKLFFASIFMPGTTR